VGGVRYASKAEAARGSALALLERAGQIANLVRQPRFPLEVNGQLVCTYVADFAYRENDQEVIEDVKGVQTETFKIKRKLLKALHGIDVRLIQGAR
jgi:hypothetical protein